MFANGTDDRTAASISYSNLAIAAKNGLETIRRYGNNLAKKAVTISKASRIVPPGSKARTLLPAFVSNGICPISTPKKRAISRAISVGRYFSVSRGIRSFEELIDLDID